MKLLPALALLPLLTTGCLWFRGVATETEPVQVDRPDGGPGVSERTPSPDRASEGPIDGAPPLVDTRGLPQLDDAEWRPVDPFIAFLPGGIRVATGQFPGYSTAHASLTLTHKRNSAASIGLALLVAHVVADTPLERGSRPSLRRAVESAGGTLTIEADASTTTLAFTAPAVSWYWLVEQLVDAARTVPSSADRVEAWRDRTARELAKRWSDDPLSAAVTRVLSFEFEGLSQWLEEVEDADLDAVVAFHEDVYRPTGALLVAARPDVEPERSMQRIASLMERWTAGRELVVFPDPIPTLPAAKGMFWSEQGEPGRFATVVEIPPAALQGSAASWLVAELMIGTSADGRIPNALQDLASEATIRIASNGPRRILEWRATAPPRRILEAQETLRKLYGNLDRTPPGDETVRAAAARARLRLMLDVGEPAGWCAEVTRSLLAGARPDILVEPGGKETPVPSDDALTSLWDALQRPDDLDVRASVRAMMERGSLLVALGVDLTAEPRFARMPDALVPEERVTLTSADVAEQREAAEEILTRAAAAVGGRSALLGLAGFHTVSLTRSGRGPEVVDREWFRLDGRFRRVRNVLASRIETVVGPSIARETCDGQAVELAEADSQGCLDAGRRHPLVLLAEWTQGRSRYRQISLRERHGRPLAVLERDGGEAGRLRLFVDAESGLIRAVVARVDLGTGAVYVREEWRDYRAAGRGLRAPHHRTTWVDDGVRGIVTTFEDVVAEAPDDEALQPGGPMR